MSMSMKVIAFHGEDDAVDAAIGFCDKHDFDYAILAPRFADRDAKGGVNTLAVVIENIVRCNRAGVGFSINAGIQALENFIPFLETARGNNMSNYKVDSSNIKSGKFDMSVMPSIFGKIAAAEKADKAATAVNAVKQPNRYFRVSVKAGQCPDLIIADTLEDAQCRADDIARHECGEVLELYEVFPLQFNGQLERLNEHMKNIRS